MSASDSSVMSKVDQVGRQQQGRKGAFTEWEEWEDLGRVNTPICILPTWSDCWCQDLYFHFLFFLFFWGGDAKEWAGWKII